MPEQTAVVHREGRQPGRSRPWVRRVDMRNLPMVVVLAVAALGLGYATVAPQHWLRGVLVVAGAMLMAGGFRLVLPARQAGLLAVRSRLVDVFFYVGIGSAIVLLGVALASSGPS